MSNRKQSNTSKLLIITLIIVLLFIFCLFGIYINSTYQQSGHAHSGSASENDQTQTSETMSINDMIQSVKAIKNDLVSALKDIKKSRLGSAKTKIEAVSQRVHTIRVSVDQTSSKFRGVPFLQKQLNSIQELLNAAEMGIGEILLPAIDLMQSHPLSELRVGDGINTQLICIYLDFVDSVMPKIDQLMTIANSVNLSLIDTDGKITQYLEQANALIDIYHTDPAIISKIKSMLGADGDRLYLLVAQNSAEIRASGGFPGSIGTMRIQDGVLTLGDFSPVKQVMNYRTPPNIQITREETELFNYLSGIKTPWDADLSPDFERVGYIWASAYEDRQHEPVAGVISMTPHIVQRLLAAMDEEVELSDGLILNGSNAIQVLQHDIYFKYFGKDYVSNRNDVSDQLFADAAQQTMKKLMGNMTLSHMLSYLSVAKESFEDRTLMVWMQDEAEQLIVTKMDWDGGLNTDPNNPETGIYFNCIAPSKMGWFLLMDSSIEGRTRNKDGSYTYSVKVVFSNNITKEEIQSASSYIIGGSDGAIYGAAYFFAPAGGTIHDFTISNNAVMYPKTYNGNQLAFLQSFFIRPNEPVTVTYCVTTAPDVDTPLAISQTPTAQQSTLQGIG